MTTLSPLPQEETPQQGRIITITYAGYVGSYWQPPEPPEGIAWCPECETETDATFGLHPEGDGTVWVRCVADHEFYANDERWNCDE